MPLKALFQSQVGAWVEPLTFRKVAGKQTKTTCHVQIIMVHLSLICIFLLLKKSDVVTATSK